MILTQKEFLYLQILFLFSFVAITFYTTITHKRKNLQSKIISICFYVATFMTSGLIIQVYVHVYATLTGQESIFLTWIASIFTGIARIILSVLPIMVSSGWLITFENIDQNQQDQDCQVVIQILGTIGFSQILSNTLHRCNYFEFGPLFSLSGYGALFAGLSRLLYLLIFLFIISYIGFKIKGKCVTQFMIILSFVGTIYYLTGPILFYLTQQGLNKIEQQVFHQLCELTFLMWWIYQDTTYQSKWYNIGDEINKQ